MFAYISVYSCFKESLTTHDHLLAHELRSWATFQEKHIKKMQDIYPNIPNA